ncbi:Ribose-5-phosphate isomerase B [Candidatus Hepatincolaceae symbiont of Richtersius coronifer]
MPENFKQKIVIGTDHRGFLLKEFLKAHLQQQNNIEVMDIGCFSQDSVDYPKITVDLAEKIKECQTQGQENVRGILICGSGIGISIAANRYSFIRAALAFNKDVTLSSRTHNDCNVICLPADYLDNTTALQYINIFLTEKFSGGRHQARIDQLSHIC